MLLAERPAFFDAKWSRQGLGLGLAVVLAASVLVAVNAQGATAQSQTADQSAAERCSEIHLFGAEPVDVAKSADGQTVLAQVSWGFHDSIGCFLAFDDDAMATLRAAGPPASLPQGQTDDSRRCFEHHRFGEEPVDVAKTADGQTVLARLSWGFHDSIGCFLALDSAATNTLRAVPPGAPGNISATAGDGQITATWTAPASDGGSPITVYTLAYKATTSGCPTTIDASWTVRTISTTSASIGDLANGTAYRLCVNAANTVGDSDWTGTTATPATTPGAPGNISATAGDSQITATWTAPASEGGAPITAYTVAYQAGATTCPTDVDSTWNPRTTSTTTTTIAGLANGTAYRVCVKATNQAGDSDWTGTTATPATTPGAPGNISATAGDSQITATWTAPADNGGAPITGYTVAYKAAAFTCPTPNSISTWTARTTSNTSITIGDLTNGTAYRLCVNAANSVGDSGWSGVSSSPSDRPGLPTSVQFTGTGPDRLTVAWTAPTATGASAITGYTIQWCTATNKVCAGSWSSASATGTSYTIAGLTGSISYGVRVQAVNSRGTGSWSNPTFASTTAATPPSTPSGLAASIDDRQIALRWNAPSANGAPITAYTVECRLGGTAIATGNCGSSAWTRYTTVSGTSTTISGLANGTAYDIRVRASNRAGSSAWATVAATPAARPRIPFDVRASNSGRNILVTWTAPSSGGSPISSYTVEFCSGGCTSWRSTTVSGNPPATTATLTGLSSGTTYRVRVRAANRAGESGWSTTGTATTPTLPGTPTDLTITTIGRDELTAAWTAPVSVSGVSHYNVQRCSAAARNDGTWRCSSGWSNAGAATGTPHTITGLNGNTAYSVRVQAANAAGTSGWSNTYTATTLPPDPPGTPSDFNAAAGNRQIRLSWTAPEANGARITRYTIECSSSNQGNHRCDGTRSDGTPNSNNTYTTSGTAYTISGLTNGVQYTFTLWATNSADNSGTTQAQATPASRPDRPSDINIDPTYTGDGRVNLAIEWIEVAKEDNGGTDITGYTVQYRAGGGNWSFVYFGTDTSTTIQGLTVGPRYYVQIRSHNAVGESNWAQASSDPTGTPAKPDPVTLSGVDRGGITAIWSAPDRGASDITDYDLQWCTARERTVTVNQVDTTTYPCRSSWRTVADYDFDTDSTSYTITGLTGRTSYSVRVRAVNVHGNGEWSDVEAGSFATTNPPLAPEPPNAPTATAGNRQVRLSWTAPEANGARITRYTIECTSGLTGNHRCDSGSANNTYTTSGTSYTISGLTNGNEYMFTVSATNSEGDSSYSSSVTAVPATRPDRPDPDDIQITETYQGGLVNLGVAWIAPENDGGSDGGITGYTVQYRSSGGNWSFHYFDTVTSTDITGLIVGRRYDVQIRTHTSAGESIWAQKSVTPTGRPGAPTSVGISGGANEVTVSWSPPDAIGASDITGYNVQRCTARETERTVSGTITHTYSCTSGWSSAGTTAAGTTNLTIGNLACGTQYGVRVQAVNSHGTGPWSDIDRDSATWSTETSACS
ncbi:fibronectin type III domain-containing protein [Candidatus Poriferisocius sp.]|uniref:fibronectin type III domain-containing protein n=1 Tax=Candidatus Poriferisocius sp. TaxID=3101276 RepID=UPI003B51EB91